MTIIVDFSAGGTFDEVATAVMARAFEKATQLLPHADPEALAKRIISVASVGERNPDQLCAKAIRGFDPSPIADMTPSSAATT
jgi:hypothetical protein